MDMCFIIMQDCHFSLQVGWQYVYDFGRLTDWETAVSVVAITQTLQLEVDLHE